MTPPLGKPLKRFTNKLIIKNPTDKSVGFNYAMRGYVIIIIIRIIVNPFN